MKIVRSIAVAALVAIPSAAQAGTCVPQSVLTWLDQRESTAISPTRWQNVRKSLLGQDGGMSLDEMKVIYNRRVANGWEASHWVPIMNAMTCLENQAPQPLQAEEEEEQPVVIPASADLPTYPAPTAHSGWFGWNPPGGNQIRRVTGSGPIPQQCRDKANNVRQSIRDSDWHISTMRKYWYELHTDRRSWWFSTVKNIGCNVKQSWDDPDGYAKCVGIGDRTAYNKRGPNGEAPGQWQWTRAPLPSIYAAQGAYASYDDWGDNSPSPVQYGVLQCGTASEQTGGSGPTAWVDFRATPLPTTHTVNEGDDWIEVSSNLSGSTGGWHEYTIVFGDGTAEMGTDYKVEMRGRFKYYDNEPFRNRSTWTEVNPNHSRMRVQLSNATGFYNIRIKPLSDTLRNEGPETVIVKFEKPSPQINTLSYRTNYCIRYDRQTTVWNRRQTCVEWSGDHYELSSMTGSGYHGYQGWSDPAKRSVTLTINDRAGGNTLAAVDKSVTVHSLTLAEGDKAPGLRGGCKGRFGFSDQQWCSGYHTVLTWTAPNHVCIFGALEMTSGNINPGFARGDLGDFNGSSWLRDRATGVGRTHQLCGSGSKQVYIRSHSDHHNEGTETANITFKVDRVLEDSQWIRSSSVAVTPGVLTITNDGPLPKEWLVRYGHAVASDTVGAVSERVRRERTPGESSVNLGAMPASGQPLYGVSDALPGSSFTATSEDRDGSTVAAWGKISTSSFGADLDDLSLSGDTTHGMAGVDYATGRWMIGVGVGHSLAEGTAAADYTLDGMLSTVFPYASYTMGGTKLWSTLGYGTGDVTLERGDEDLGTADTSWRMAAAGVRSRLAQGEYLGLSLVGDVFWSEIDSDKAVGFEGSEASSHRERVGVEADLQWGDITLVPTAFARLDGGDVGNEATLELAGDATWAVREDLTLSASGSHVLNGENDFHSYSVGLVWSTQYGSPALSYAHDDVYVVGWTMFFKGGHVNVETRPQAQQGHLNLLVTF